MNQGTARAPVVDHVTAREVVSRVKGTKRSGKGWVAQCPAHEDDRPSLSIGEGAEGRVLLKCQAGCSFEAVCTALGIDPRSLGPDAVDRPATKKCRRQVAEYNYLDEQRKLLFQVVRYDPKDFRPRRPNGQGGWLYSLGDNMRRVLYHLPEILGAGPAVTVFVVEGEKDADKLAGLGLLATTNAGGAGKWRREYSENLLGRHVVILPDNDQPGLKHATQVAASLQGAAASVKIVQLPNLPPNGDVSDWLEAGGSADDLLAIVQTRQEHVPPIETGAVNTANAKDGRPLLTPSRWFAEKFPSLSDEFGEAILERTNKQGIVSARDIGEDFLAGTLGVKGSPDEPTVFVPTEQRFYTYSSKDGIFTHQRDPILLARLSRLLLSCARACRDECDTGTLEFRFRDSANLTGVLRKARGLLEVPNEFFATELTEFIPCANGMLRLSDKMLLPFSASYRRRNKLTVPFDATAKCPLFLDTLMNPALDHNELDLLQRWCGLALIGENLAQKIVILTGTPGGGKGTFVRVLQGIIGPINLASLRPQLLGERFELGRFLGKTLLYGPDVPENFLNQRGAAVLKSLTGHDPMTLEFKNSNESPSIVCKFNVIVTCNSRLTVHLEGDINAWRRRLAIVDYHKPKPARVIADLDQRILMTEAPGVLNWMLEGLYKLRADGWQLYLTVPQQASVNDLLLESDGHVLFVQEEVRRADGHALTVLECFAAYVQYCSEHGWVALTRNKFGQVIGDVVTGQYGITVRHDIRDASGKAQRGWQGLSLRRRISTTDF